MTFVIQTFLYLKAKDMAGETDLTVLLRAMQPVLSGRIRFVASTISVPIG